MAQVPVLDNSNLAKKSETQTDTTNTDTTTKDIEQSSGGLKCSVSRSDAVTSLNTAADQYNIPRQYMENAARVESGCNPDAKAKGSSAGGLGQFIDSTWATYGNDADKFDPDANADAMARLTKNDVTELGQRLNRSPTFEEAYLAHQQGLGGASCLLKNPAAAATSCVSSSAITGNGGNTGMSSGEFSALVEGYYNTGSLSGARAAAAQYASTGQMPNSGNFADGSNGTAPMSASQFPPLKDTTTQAAKLDDAGQTSTTASSYSADLKSTQSDNVTLLEQRAAAIGRSDSSKDAMDVNSRMRADQVQLTEEAIDATNVWASLLGSQNLAAVTLQSTTSGAMATSGSPSKPSSDVMPGIPSPSGSKSVCDTVTASDGTCVPAVTDNITNVSAYLSNVAAAVSAVPSTTPTN
ncbi:transglycosylase SLT domain-containing protein [Rhizobium sp. VS19-DR104.2]|uniref:transglycosylase SLT domain-containing protein n=1 Tax=unclassified Rhizobium TaxID=2613769 RepID=UPI001CC362D3|nr:MULTISPECIES: transglycosylase SLT domain-containing protein [unclassified Rhizobium]MBZ5762286.1 transglycosylase SLT domain-containing protein [Rhizobium sp. VS19-DR96]MBZ5768302.1 transglycosylase SLT domain-containing protein [Rhizobium sp. VS19-DR129.2]MBZ5775826.1 transglycosylase SLT domain-containing protein [Rhizobium sp. VS19-DRK62.2]MBZ5787153.1 transglycosylase SLT domain-containing protein [Rhizobium sp. VS19-DR121]MBZ5804228.1 transglycosylase SLT domain-containing protein [Rh